MSNREWCSKRLLALPVAFRSVLIGPRTLGRADMRRIYGSRGHLDFVPAAVLEDGYFEHVCQGPGLSCSGGLPGRPALRRELDGGHLGFGLDACHAAPLPLNIG